MIRVHSYESMGTFDGPGLRLVVFLQGCNFRCLYCANPDTIDTKGESTETTIDEIVRMAVSQKAFFGKKGGVTFSGGDPFHLENREEIGALAKEIREKFPDKTIWLYTGYRWEEISALPLMQYIDVLVDGKFIADLKDTKLHWKGSFNQRIIDVQKSLQSSSLYLYHAE